MRRATPLDRVPSVVGRALQDLYLFAEGPLRDIGASNDTHWRRGGGTFFALCPKARLDAWHRDAVPQRVATGARAAVGAGLQSAVALVDGALAACVVGLQLVFGRLTRAREVAAHHFYPLASLLLAAHVVACVGLIAGISLLLRAL